MTEKKEAWKAFCKIFGVAALVFIFLESVVGLDAVWLQVAKFLSLLNWLVAFMAFQFCKEEEEKEN